jgi:hypothetical protein
MIYRANNYNNLSATMDNTNGTYMVTYYSKSKSTAENNTDSLKLFYKNIEVLDPSDAENKFVTNY